MRNQSKKIKSLAPRHRALHTLITSLLLAQALSATTVLAEQPAAPSEIKNALAAHLVNVNPRSPDADDTQRVRVIKGIFYSLAGLLLVGSCYRQIVSRGKGIATDSIELLSRRYITNELALAVVRVDGKKFLLSQSKDAVRFVATLDAEQNSPLNVTSESPASAASPSLAVIRGVS